MSLEDPQIVKQGGKYIVFLPIVDNIEDEDGNKVGRKKGKNKIEDYEKQIAEYFKDSSITPNFHSMLGEYGDKENARRLEEFQNANNDATEFMLVMNKANEGLHLDKLDGIIWLRPLDENSRILYLQQLGRCIYSEDPDNPTKDENRPVVIDLVNNTLKVNWNIEITEQDDIELLTIISDWVEKHDGALPNINSTDKEETGYAAVLKEIQAKYKGYLENKFENLNENQIEEIKQILNLGALIDLWNTKLPDLIIKNNLSHERSFSSSTGGPFELIGILKDFVELENEVDEKIEKSAISEILRIANILQSEGVKLGEIQLSKIVGKQQKRILLKEIEQDGINIQKIIEENGLDGNFKYGQQVAMLREAYKGRGNCKITEKEKEEVKKLDLIPEETKSVVSRTLEVVRILKKSGINIKNIQLSKTIKGETIYILLKEIKQDGINIEKIIKENGLDENYMLGRNIKNTRNAYNGVGSYSITEEEKREVEKLGIFSIKRERTGKEIAEATISSLKDIEMADKEDMILNQLIEKTKEGEIKRDE